MKKISMLILMLIALICTGCTVSVDKVSDTDPDVTEDTEKKSKKAKKELSSKEKKLIVPDVVGLRYTEATEKLAEGGLLVNIIQADSDSVAVDYVISQSPTAGKKVPREDIITVYVSSKKEDIEASSPDDNESAQQNSTGKILYCRASEFATLRASHSTSGEELARIGSREGVQYIDSNGGFYYVIYKGQKGYVLKDLFSEDPNAAIDHSYSTPIPDYTVYYCCASESATLRTSPSRSGAALAKIGSREEVQCYGSDGEFYNVTYKGQNGYVLKDFFSQDPNCPLNYGSGNAPVPASSDIYYCRASESATLRSDASRDSAALTQIGSRESVKYISSAGEFYYVSYQGQNGYVLKDYFSTDPSAALNYGRN